MLFAINVHGVLTMDSSDVRPQIRHFNELLELGISEAAIERMVAFVDLFAMPELQAYLRARPETGRMIVETARSQSLRAAKIPMPGSQKGIRELSEHGKVIYVTSTEPSQAKQLQAWLQRYAFPCTDQVFCTQHYPSTKLLLAGKQSGPNDQIYLIDDELEDVFGSLRPLYLDMKNNRIDQKWGFALLKRLHFISFGSAYIPPLSARKLFDVHCLPAWDFLSHILAKV